MFLLLYVIGTDSSRAYKCEYTTVLPLMLKVIHLSVRGDALLSLKLFLQVISQG